MPGTRMIRLASTTDLIASGTTNALTTIATVVATNAQITSLATARRGLLAASKVMPPMIRPITAATTRPPPELGRNSPAIPAAATPSPPPYTTLQPPADGRPTAQQRP